jgi:hypothetical protein
MQGWASLGTRCSYQGSLKSIYSNIAWWSHKPLFPYETRNSFKNGGLMYSRREDRISGIRFDEHLIKPWNQISFEGLLFNNPTLHLVEDDVSLALLFCNLISSFSKRGTRTLLTYPLYLMLQTIRVWRISRGIQQQRRIFEIVEMNFLTFLHRRHRCVEGKFCFSFT